MGKLKIAIGEHGHGAPQFEKVRAAFADNFAARGEVGAAVCVYHNGAPVVDLWAGHLDAASGRPWQRDTIVSMMSVTKGMLALSAHALVEEGKLDLNANVADYWPAFAQAGKQNVTVRQLISHFAGVLYPDLAPAGSYTDWDVMTDALARQPPQWPPGTQGAYHSSTYGYLVGNLIRCASGETFPQVFDRRFNVPLGTDFHCGLTPAQDARAATLMPNPASATLKAAADVTTNLGRAWRPNNGIDPRMPRDVELGSVNGYGNARSAARIFAALAQGGEIDGVRVLNPATVETLRTEQWVGTCGLTGRPFRMAMGLFLNYPPLMPLGPNAPTFGHAGAGGALAFADPVANVSFSYCTNTMCAGAGLGDRCEALIAALYESL